MFINHGISLSCFYSICAKKKEKQRPKKTRRAIVCRCVEEFPAFVGGNFLLFFIMFGKYRLPRKAFVSLSSSAGKQKKKQTRVEGEK